MNRYYCTHRLPAPGTIPSGALHIHRYDERLYVLPIDRMAWGCVEYGRELAPSEIAAYHLISEPRPDEWD